MNTSVRADSTKTRCCRLVGAVLSALLGSGCASSSAYGVGAAGANKSTEVSPPPQTPRELPTLRECLAQDGQGPISVKIDVAEGIRSQARSLGQHAGLSSERKADGSFTLADLELPRDHRLRPRPAGRGYLQRMAIGGDHLYAVSGDTLYVVSTGGAGLRLVATAPLVTEAIGLALAGSRVVVIGENHPKGKRTKVHIPNTWHSSIDVLDVSRPGAPESLLSEPFTEEFELARVVGGQVLVLLLQSRQPPAGGEDRHREGMIWTTVRLLDLREPSAERSNVGSLATPVEPLVEITDDAVYLATQADPATDPTLFLPLLEGALDEVEPSMPDEDTRALRRARREGQSYQSRFDRPEHAFIEAYCEMIPKLSNGTLTRVISRVNEVLLVTPPRTRIEKLWQSGGRLTHGHRHYYEGKPLNRFALDVHAGRVRLAVQIPGGARVLALDEELLELWHTSDLAEVFAVQFLGNSVAVVPDSPSEYVQLIDTDGPRMSTAPRPLRGVTAHSALLPFGDQGAAVLHKLGDRRRDVAISLFDLSGATAKRTASFGQESLGLALDFGVYGHSATLVVEEEGLLGVPVRAKGRRRSTVGLALLQRSADRLVLRTTITHRDGAPGSDPAQAQEIEASLFDGRFVYTKSSRQIVRTSLDHPSQRQELSLW